MAANRLMEALNNNGVKAKMLVRDKQTRCLTVASTGHGWLQQWNFLWERLRIFVALRFSRKHLFDVDIANAGIDITTFPEFQEADVIHLHWINQGFLSLAGIRKILASGKPVVWTMHDMWPATGICHYAHDCGKILTGCGDCPLLPGQSSNDLAARVWRKKERLLQKGKISFVACSQWLEKAARESALLKDQEVTNIPNAIDTRVFRPTDRKQARRQLGLPEEGKVILFVSQRVTDERKGLRYLTEAVAMLAEQHPELRQTATVVILGGHAEEVESQLALPSKSLGYVNDEQTLVSVYNAADVFVLPSLEDNLPNTIMEAMACGVPCVGFNVGGIPEMIDHEKTGYVAEPRNSADLARGLAWTLLEADAESLHHEAVRKVARNYSQSSVATRYSEIYQKVLGNQQL